MTTPRRSASMGTDLSRLRSLCLSGVAKRCRKPRFVNAPSRARSSLLTMVVPKLPASLETVRDLGAQPQKKTIPFSFALFGLSDLHQAGGGGKLQKFSHVVNFQLLHQRFPVAADGLYGQI